MRKPWFRVIEITEAAPLPAPQDSWGLASFAAKEKQRRREREKKRRQRAMAALAKVRIALPVEKQVKAHDVFRTSSGILAIKPKKASADGYRVSLPYVEFLHGKQHIDA